MERLDVLLERIRRYTYNQQFTDAGALGSQIGLQTQTLVDLFNEAHTSLRGIIYNNAPSVFMKTTNIDLVADQESYTLPSDGLLGGNVISVEYKYGDASGDYTKLDQANIHQRASNQTGTPQRYIHLDNTILVNPVPTSAKTDGLRVTYEYRVRDIDVRRGKVSAVDDANNPTSITITDKSHMDVAMAAGAAPEYISVVDKDGVAKMDNIHVSAYDSGTGVLTVSVSASSTESVAVNDYVVLGKTASSHSDYPDFCEPYLTEYVKASVMELDGHPLAGASNQKLRQYGLMVADAYADYNIDINYIAEIDEDRQIGW